MIINSKPIIHYWFLTLVIQRHQHIFSFLNKFLHCKLPLTTNKEIISIMPLLTTTSHNMCNQTTGDGF